MRIEIEHITTYHFAVPQGRLVQLLRVTPPSNGLQTILDWNVDVNVDARMFQSLDGYGNHVTMLYVDGPVSSIEIAKRGTVLTKDGAGVFAPHQESLPPLAFLAQTDQTRPSEAITTFAHELASHSPGRILLLHSLMTQIDDRMVFDPGEGNAGRTASMAFEEGHGVCQDFAHIFCAAARSLGIPARYVSGHLCRVEDTVEEASHAWAEAWVPDLGWVGFDVANGICPDESYVRVATGLDYSAAAPLSGARVGGGDEALDVSVAVRQGQQ
jgi:transglutaminase-like putative cysteine protease